MRRSSPPKGLNRRVPRARFRVIGSVIALISWPTINLKPINAIGEKCNCEDIKDVRAALVVNNQKRKD